MPSSYIQRLVTQVQPVVNKVFGVLNENSVVVACSDLKLIGQKKNVEVPSDLQSPFVFKDVDCTYKLISLNETLTYTVFIEGITYMDTQILTMFSMMMQNAQSYHKAQYDQSEFIRNIALNNILQSDLFIKAQEYDVEYEAVRVTFIVSTVEKRIAEYYSLIYDRFAQNKLNFVFKVDSKRVALVKDFSGFENDARELSLVASDLMQLVSVDVQSQVVVGFSSVVQNLSQLERSFKEATVAASVGEIFFDSCEIVDYNKLGLCRLIYQLPVTLCETFLKEIFKKKKLDMLDAETTATIVTFFDNDLNISETAKALFIHRNTLVYRLEKIRRLTGLDLRKFEDATVFKISTMVKKYLDYNLQKTSLEKSTYL